MFANKAHYLTIIHIKIFHHLSLMVGTSISPNSNWVGSVTANPIKPNPTLHTPTHQSSQNSAGAMNYLGLKVH